ncbi:MAG: VUT family protein, partial [Candidatus Helarchaeota archaeon]
IIDWGFSLGSIQLSFNAGTLLFPISYVIGDVMTEVYGFQRSRRIIWIGFGSLIFSALAFNLFSCSPAKKSGKPPSDKKHMTKSLFSLCFHIMLKWWKFKEIQN